MALTSAQLFAARGDEWNRPNYQHFAGPRVAEIEDSRNGRKRLELVGWAVEGYGPEPVTGPRAAIHKPDFQEPNPAPRVTRRKEELPRLPARPWTPEYRPVRPVYDLAPAQPLTEEQLALRKKQRAAVKARLTRARNRIEREETERKDAIAELIARCL